SLNLWLQKSLSTMNQCHPPQRLIRMPMISTAVHRPTSFPHLHLTWRFHHPVHIITTPAKNSAMDGITPSLLRSLLVWYSSSSTPCIRLVYIVRTETRLRPPKTPLAKFKSKPL